MRKYEQYAAYQAWSGPCSLLSHGPGDSGHVELVTNFESDQLRVNRDGTFQPLPGMVPVQANAQPTPAP